MRIALLAPLPPEKNGIADYASHFRNALQGLGIEVATPLAGVAADSANIASRLDSVDWNAFDLVHAELGGGRLGEFIALRELRKRFPRLPLSATVHDPERMVWRRERLPWPLNLLERLPSPLPQAAVVLADPLTLREERAVAQGLTRLVTLTGLGGECLARRMRLPPGRVEVINHGNLEIATVPLPSLDTLRLLYFGFIYRGKGIEDLLEALADLFASAPEMRQRVRLTLPHLARPIAVVLMIETIFLLSVFAEIFTTTSGGPGYESTNLAYLIYNQALLQFDVGMASAGGLIAVLIANIAAIVLVRMIGKNLTERS